MTYEFVCSGCHHHFEVRQPIQAEHKALCPLCGDTAKRVYSQLEVIWAGSAYRRDGTRREDKDYAPVFQG